MKHLGLAVISLAVLAGSAGAAAPVPEKPTHSHAGEISVYEGTKTCAGCHPDAVKDVAVSLHYQQLGNAPFVTSLKPDAQVGMMGSY